MNNHLKFSPSAARHNAGYTQRAVAEILGVSKSTITSYEKYRTSPDMRTAAKMAALYGLSIGDIAWNPQQ